MPRFRIDYLDPRTGAACFHVGDYEDTAGSYGVITAREWAEDHAYMLADKAMGTVRITGVGAHVPLTLIGDRISKPDFDAQSYIIYRGWIIDHRPEGLPHQQWVYHHEDYVGSEDMADGRFGLASSVEEAKAAIDLIHDPLHPAHGVAFCTIREACLNDKEDIFHLECRFENGEKFAAVTVDHDKEALVEFLAQAINGAPVVELKAIEEIVYHQFYAGGGLAGSKTRLARALQAYLNALLRGQDVPDPTRTAA